MSGGLYPSVKEAADYTQQRISADAIGVDPVSITISGATLGDLQGMASDITVALNTLQSAVAASGAIKINP